MGLTLSATARVQRTVAFVVTATIIMASPDRVAFAGGAAHDGADDGRATTPADVALAAAPAHGDAPAPLPATDAIRMVMDGNDRFVAGTPQRPHQNVARLCETFTGGQHPYAAVLSCADSRVPVELVFDAGIGDLFVVRVAGNVADVDEVGTLEYGVEHLGINAVVVLGHGKCGAVTAVVDGAEVTPNIAKLVDNIAGPAAAARKATPTLSGPRLVARAIRLNVKQATAELTSRSPLLKEKVESGELKIIGGVYDLHTGQVDWLDGDSVAGGEPPTVTEKVAAAKDDDGHAPAAKPAVSAKRIAAPEAQAGADADNGHAAPPEPVAKPKAAVKANTKASLHGDDEADAHARPAKVEKGGHSDAPPHEANDDKHAEAGHADEGAKPTTASAAKASKENYVALGICTGGAAALSCGVMHFLGRGKSTPAHATTREQAKSGEKA